MVVAPCGLLPSATLISERLITPLRTPVIPKSVLLPPKRLQPVPRPAHAGDRARDVVRLRSSALEEGTVDEELLPGNGGTAHAWSRSPIWGAALGTAGAAASAARVSDESIGQMMVSGPTSRQYELLIT